MIPTTPIEGGDSLPICASFWTPDLSALTEDEGFGFFRDTWPILDIPHEFAQQVVSTERIIVDCLSQLASSPAHYERLAQIVENWDPDVIEEDLSSGEHAAISGILRNADDNPLDSLELGVSGLSLALSSIGAYPAASCRGHGTAHAWSRCPVVYFAATRSTAVAVESALQKSACRFVLDDARPTLLCVAGSSALDTNQLASALLEHES